MKRKPSGLQFSRPNFRRRSGGRSYIVSVADGEDEVELVQESVKKSSRWWSPRMPGSNAPLRRNLATVTEVKGSQGVAREPQDAGRQYPEEQNQSIAAASTTDDALYNLPLGSVRSFMITHSIDERDFDRKIWSENKAREAVKFVEAPSVHPLAVGLTPPGRGFKESSADGVEGRDDEDESMAPIEVEFNKKKLPSYKNRSIIRRRLGF